MQRLKLLIEGRVQGVYFRASTHEVAQGLQVVGWVRNLADGRVEVLAEGSRDQLDLLLTFCRRGPPNARVDKLEETWTEARGGLGSGFRVT